MKSTSGSHFIWSLKANSYMDVCDKQEHKHIHTENQAEEIHSHTGLCQRNYTINKETCSTFSNECYQVQEENRGNWLNIN